MEPYQYPIVRDFMAFVMRPEVAFDEITTSGEIFQHREFSALIDFCCKTGGCRNYCRGSYKRLRKGCFQSQRGCSLRGINHGRGCPLPLVSGDCKLFYRAVLALRGVSEKGGRDAGGRLGTSWNRKRWKKQIRGLCMPWMAKGIKRL